MASTIPSNLFSSVSSSSSSSSAGQSELSREQIICKRTFSEMTNRDTANAQPIRQLHPLPSSSSSSAEIEDLCSLRIDNPNAARIPSNSSSSASSSAGQSEHSREQAICKRTFSQMTNRNTVNAQPMRQLQPLPSSSSSSTRIEAPHNPNTAREPKRTKIEPSPQGTLSPFSIKTESLRAPSLTASSSSSSNSFPTSLKQEIPTWSSPEQIAPISAYLMHCNENSSLKNAALAAIQVCDYESAKTIIAQKKIWFHELEHIAEQIFERTPVLSEGALSALEEIVKISNEKKESSPRIFKGLMNAKTSSPLEQNLVHDLLRTLSQNLSMKKGELMIEAIQQSKFDIASILLPPDRDYSIGVKNRGTCLKELMRGQIFNADLLKTLLQTTEQIPEKDIEIAVRKAAEKNNKEALTLLKFWTFNKPVPAKTWSNALKYATDPACIRIIETSFEYLDMEKYYEMFKKEFE